MSGPRGGSGPGRGGFSLPSHTRGRGGGFGQGRARGSDRGADAGGGRGTASAIFSHGPNDSAQADVKRIALENEIEKSVLKNASRDDKATVLPIRPAYGTQGKKVLLWANYMEMAVGGGQSVYRYQVAIPKSKLTNREFKVREKKDIIELLVRRHFPQAGPQIVSDFKSHLVSTAKLNIRPNGYDILYPSEREDMPIRVDLSLDGTFTISDLVGYLTSSNPEAILHSKEDIIQLLNIIIGHNPKSAPHIASASNRHYNWQAVPPERMSLGSGLLAIRGFFLSVRAATGRLLLNVQVKHSPFYETGPLEQVMTTFMKCNGPNKLKLQKFLEGMSISTAHLARQNTSGHQIRRTKVVCGLATERDGQQEPRPKVRSFGAGPRDVQFFCSEIGRHVSVYDYFRQHYNITITNHQLPVVNVGSKAFPIYLPAQVCQVDAQEFYKAELPASETRQMIRFAVRKPAQNAQSLVREGWQMVNYNQAANPTHEAFKIKLNPRLITVPGRVLSSPAVKYAGGKAASTSGGGWNMANTKFVTSSSLSSWTYLFITTASDQGPWQGEFDVSVLSRFATEMRKVGITCDNCAPGRRIQVVPTVPANMNTPAVPGTVDTAIDLAIHNLTACRDPPKLLLVVLASDRPEIYNRVKYVCDVKEGILNVCVRASTLARANAQLFANIALKVNLKLGGHNQNLEPAKLGIISEGKTMVVGLDVTHPSPGSLKTAPSVVGIVASIDQWLGQWPADMRIQPSRQEEVEDLKDLIKGRLRVWTKYNHGALPENIIMMRDGVGEGSMKMVGVTERESIKAACSEVYPADMTKKGLPRLTVTVVSKRHNTRFYPAVEADRFSNTMNGTVVDRGVTEARNWDFFLQAHTALQGTARPAHYYVVYDEIFRSEYNKPGAKNNFQSAADVLEDLVHNMCYLFGRATKAVSICPPAYYADLVCDRSRLYLSSLFDPSTASDSSGETGQGADASMVRIHEKIKDSMFYI